MLALVIRPLTCEESAMMNLRMSVCLLLAVFTLTSTGDEAAPSAAPLRNISPELKAALEKLELPGVKINLDEWSVDVDSRIALKEGLLELIACVRDTKEHESFIVIDAKPSHVHTALLLLGAKPGNPAINQPIDPEMTRFRFVPPSGGPVDVYLVFKDADGKLVEKPINEFIKAADHQDLSVAPEPEGVKEKFSTHRFLFSGSILVGDGDGPRRYLCDTEGNVISISTFGDELLCLPGFHDHANEALMWQVDGDNLPALDSKVILRLRPVEAEKLPGNGPAPEDSGKNPGKK